MPGLYSRIKTWVSGEVLYAADLNAEFDNIITNDVPLKIDDYSATTTQMRIQTSPGAQGSESLATSLAGELERLRYVIARITGKTYWYDAPDRNLLTEKSADDVAFYLPFQSNEGTTAGVLQNAIERGAVINALSRSSADVSSSYFDTINKVFGSASYGLGAGRVLAYPGLDGSVSQGALSMHARSLNPGEYLAYNPLLGVELYLDGSGFLTTRIRKATAAAGGVKDFATVAGTSSRSGVTSFKHIACSWAANAVNGAATDAIALYYDGATEGTQLSGSSIALNGSRDNLWFFGARPNDPAWSKYSSMNVVPGADGWTVDGTSGQGTVSNGVLTIASADLSSAHCAFSLATNVDLSNMTIDFKVKLDDVSQAGKFLEDAMGINLIVRDDSMNRSMNVFMHQSGITIRDAASNTTIKAFRVNLSDWKNIRITTSGATNPVVKLYVNGALQGSTTLQTADVTATDIIQFGHVATSSACAATSYWEWFAYQSGTATVYPPVQGGVGGQIDDVLCGKTALTSSVLLLLKTSSGRDVFNNDFNRSLTLPDEYLLQQPDSTGYTSTSYAHYTPVASSAEDGYLYFVSDGVSKLRLCVHGYVFNSNAGESAAMLFEIDGKALESSGYTAGGMLLHEEVAVPATAAPFRAEHILRLSPGLHKLGVFARVSGGAGFINFGRFSVVKAL